MTPRTRQGRQLAIELPPELLQRLKAHAAAAEQPVAAVVRRWIEAGLAGAVGQGAAPAPADLAERLAAVEAALAQLQAARPSPERVSQPSPVRVTPSPERVQLTLTGEQSPPPAGALESAQVAERLGMTRHAFNEAVRRAGGAAEGLVFNGWRCVGRRAPDRGGPPRSLWEPLGTPSDP